MQPRGCLKVPARKSFFMQINVFVNTTGIFGLSQVWKDTEFFNSSNNYSQQIKVFINFAKFANGRFEKIADQFLGEESSEL